MKIIDYHFLIPLKLKEELNTILELDKYSFSKKIKFVLIQIEKIIHSIKEINIDENSKVEYLKNKKNIHLYINKKLYRNLKYYHGKFNIYSMALLVRLMIKLFIKMVKKYGFSETLNKINKQYKILKKMNKINNRKLTMLQLLKFVELKSFKNIRLQLILTKLLL